MTKPGSPQHFRDLWSRAKSRLEDFLERGFLFRIVALIVLVAVQYSLCFVVMAAQPRLNVAYVYTFQTFFLSLSVWGVGGLILQRSPLARGPLMVLLSLIHMTSVVLFFGQNEYWAGNVLQILMMFLQPAMAYALCSVSEKWPAWTAWLTSLSIAAVAYGVFFVCAPISSVAWLSLRSNPTRYVMFLTFFALQFYFLRARFKNRNEKLSYVFNPTQTLFPLPLPVDGVQGHPNNRTYAQALMNIIFATAALAVFLTIAWCGFPSQKVPGVLLGWISQFLSLFYLAAFSVGMLQWCGFTVPHPCDFALLSASPHMRWRRWNRYTYKWLSLTVFFPVLQKTNSRLFALLLSFFVVALLHVNALLFVPGAKPAQEFLLTVLRNHFAYYTAHGLAIWLGFYVPSSWTDERRNSSWAGVILTWVLTACIFAINY